MFIFLDESGDLGFDFGKPKTSRHFVIALLVCDDKLTQTGIRTAVSRTLKNKLNQKKTNKRFVTELKGSQTTLEIKQYFYRQMPDSGWRIYSVTLNKSRVEAHLRTREGKKKLYNFLARFLLEKVKFPEHLDRVHLARPGLAGGIELVDQGEQFPVVVVDHIDSHPHVLLPCGHGDVSVLPYPRKGCSQVPWAGKSRIIGW